MLRCSDAFTRPLTRTSVFSSWLINKLWNEVVCLNCVWDWSGRLGGAFLLVLPINPLTNFFFQFLILALGGHDDDDNDDI